MYIFVFICCLRSWRAALSSKGGVGFGPLVVCVEGGGDFGRLFSVNARTSLCVRSYNMYIYRLIFLVNLDICIFVCMFE